MGAAILLQNDTLAYSRILSSIGEVTIDWPDDGVYTPYGFIMGLNAEVTHIAEFLEQGPDDFHIPYVFLDGVPHKHHRVHGVLIDARQNVYHLDLNFPNPGGDHYPILKCQRIFTGPGANWVLADTVTEHEKAIMSLRLCETMGEALELFTNHTNCMQHMYVMVKVTDIAKNLEEMGYDLRLPKNVFKKQPETKAPEKEDNI